MQKSGPPELNLDYLHIFLLMCNQNCWGSVAAFPHSTLSPWCRWPWVPAPFCRSFFPVLFSIFLWMLCSGRWHWPEGLSWFDAVPALVLLHLLPFIVLFLIVCCHACCLIAPRATLPVSSRCSCCFCFSWSLRSVFSLASFSSAGAGEEGELERAEGEDDELDVPTSLLLYQLPFHRFWALSLSFCFSVSFLFLLSSSSSSFASFSKRFSIPLSSSSVIVLVFSSFA